MHKQSKKRVPQSRWLFVGIDLHSDNSYVVVIDQKDKRLFEKRLKNRLGEILEALELFRDRIQAIAVESTYNWYWLVDGLKDAGYEVKLVNTTAVQQYSGLKCINDRHDAAWLAHLLRLGILPTGYIYPPEQRAVRDLLRKRLGLVQQRTANTLSLQNLQQRNAGVHMSRSELRKFTPESIGQTVSDANLALALSTTRQLIMTLDEEIAKIEKAVLSQVKLLPEYQHLTSVWGIGRILAMTIMLETGPISRFPTPGDYVSYCRLVAADHISNGKKKGEGNVKNGNRYLAWAFVEASHHAIIHYATAKRWYSRKVAKTMPVVARKALAHKLSRASYYVLRDGVRFNPKLLFGC